MRTTFLCTCAAVALCCFAACVDDAAAPTPPGPPTPEPTCITNPTIHVEIINACTSDDVVRIAKVPVLPLLATDGSLPPLP